MEGDDLIKVFFIISLISTSGLLSFSFTTDNKNYSDDYSKELFIEDS